MKFGKNRENPAWDLDEAGNGLGMGFVPHSPTPTHRTRLSPSRSSFIVGQVLISILFPAWPGSPWNVNNSGIHPWDEAPQRSALG